MIIIGYARKSLNNASQESRVQCLQTMVNRLRQRSLATKVFVSPASAANDPISSRDTPRQQDILDQLKEIDGTTQGKRHFASIRIN